ncbi:RNA repair transcriptional activator RtcR [Citrobacter portucalensis]|uniref:RNA repair transcriptional activator RtcR n=1 Tax=Citrobacter portucalensis TaxID=1639133 RepID=UPI000FEBB3F0|nr:RNA repair transcriptional activator RtcR [Citrobacter portucalensis]RWT94968.1 sigma 54-dependent transcriptional regulator [Citrobacter freundii]MDV0515583.1 RNA repair transcriptional activator RtcR [Citrobacter portucalensis]MDV0520788.1 RNA repair transcriptional activator RtcR [Citrobacter portucalensis]MDV0566303.1 RNA repair transcriptional activator RtcR [Citrobacter portucalensis]MEB0754243.1 RNA repair transcriptional activator RtcR [Citrobacter portucalensis]
MKKRRVVIGVLGTVLDKRGKRANRFKKWRPTVGLCQQPDFPVDRLELLHQPRDEGMAQRLIEDVALLSPDTEVRPHAVTINDPWDFEEVYAAFLDFATHYSFDTENEEYLVHITTGTHVAQICWFLLTEARYLPASLLQTSPAPAGSSDEAVAAGVCSIIDLDLSRYATLTSRFQREQQQSVSFLKAGIDTRNATFNKLIDRIERVALRSTDPILLTGPTGAGKSFLAKRIFQLRQSRHLVAGKLVAVNCATLRGDNAMSTLFGHVKGAFTGALTARSGLLREADGGVLFLDEIAELGLDEQAMLLKAIEEKTFFPFGSDKEVHSDFQLIAGTHRDMQQWVAEGRFREDLYARINMWNFALPGLAQRREDIAPNVEYELHRFSSRKQMQIRFDKEARVCYLAFACSPQAQWRGNFRELSSSIARMATLAEQGRITLSLVEEEIALLKESWQITASQPELNMDIDLFDRRQLETVLEVCRRSASLSEAGRELFAVSRQKKANPNDADRLRKYLARFGLSWENVRSGT